MLASLASLVALLFIPALAAPATELEIRQSCADVIVFFARGTTELPPTGSVIGPPFQAALQSQLGGRSLQFNGVNYAADVPGFLIGGDPIGSRQMATDVSLNPMVKFHLPNQRAPNRLPTRQTDAQMLSSCFLDTRTGFCSPIQP